MTNTGEAPPTVVILARQSQRSSSLDGALPLALRRVCGVPLVRRHLQIVRPFDWRHALVVTAAGQSPAVAQAIGDPAALGVELRCIEAAQGTLPAEALLQDNGSWFLLLEGHYVIEGALLRALRSVEKDAVLCDSRPPPGVPLTLLVQDGQIKAWGDQGAARSLAYSGAVLLSRTTLHRASMQGEVSWPGMLVASCRLQALDVRTVQRYSAETRRSVDPFWRAVETPPDAELCKRALVQGAQKHTVNPVAWHINRPLEIALTLRIADSAITPNQVTLLTSSLGYLVTALFLLGRWLPAWALTALVNVLDGVDGKLARAKGMSSQLGQLEHSLDLLYEQSWYIAFTWASYLQHDAAWVLPVGFVLLLWDSFARHVSMQFRQTAGISLSDVAPFDRAFRQVDGRRQTYTLHMLGGILTGRPHWAVCTMALHALVTGLVYALRAAKHLRARDRGVFRAR